MSSRQQDQQHENHDRRQRPREKLHGALHSRALRAVAMLPRRRGRALRPQAAHIPAGFPFVLLQLARGAMAAGVPGVPATGEGAAQGRAPDVDAANEPAV